MTSLTWMYLIKLRYFSNGENNLQFFFKIQSPFFLTWKHILKNKKIKVTVRILTIYHVYLDFAPDRIICRAKKIYNRTFQMRLISVRAIVLLPVCICTHSWHDDNFIHCIFMTYLHFLFISSWTWPKFISAVQRNYSFWINRKSNIINTLSGISPFYIFKI